MVHQHFMLIPVMTVAENIVLGIEPSDKGFLDYDAARARVRELARTFGFAIDPDARIEDISVGQQQRVEILKALYRNADILILDEPTAVLTPQEATELFGILADAAARGHLDHLHQPQAQRGARDRRPRHRAAPRQEDRDRAARGRDAGVARARDGRARGAPPRREGAGAAGRRRCSRSRTCTCSTTAASRRCAASRSTVRAGEIVGIAGVDGNGQTELIDAITGLRKIESGSVAHRGRRAPPRERPRRPRRRRRAHPGGPPAARARARVLDRREHRAARLPQAAERAARLALSEAPGREGARADPRVRRPRRRAADARGRALRRQPAEGRSSRARSTATRRC